MKMIMKKMFWMLAVVGVLFCVGIGHSTHAFAAVVYDSNSDNTTATANNMTIGDTVSGTITETDELDYYKFTLSSAGCVTLNMTSYMRYYCINVYGSDGKEIWYTDWNEWTESVGYRRDTYDLYLEKGTYYMQVNGYSGKYNTSNKSTGKYECNTKFQSSNVSFNQDNNSFATASSISWNTEYRGQISENDEYDTYKFQVSPSKTVVVNMTSYMKYYCINIFNTNGEEIWYTDWNMWTESVGYRTDMHNIVLSSGTYYMQINGYSGKYNTSDKSTGKYRFKLEELNHRNCIHEYTDKTVYPTYFAKGYDIHKCVKCGKTYKDEYTAKKKLEQSDISIFSSGGRGKLYLQWYTVSDASGYQIRYCRKKAMTKGVKIKTIKGKLKSKKTIKKLSRKKRYYVQIRAYKKSGAKIVYGKWSAKKVLKTK